MEQSESIKELAGALAKAQAALKPAEMNATNPFLKNKYADLGEVIKASRQALADAGLSFVQAVAGTGENVIITTQLMHASGEWIRETIAFPLGEARGKSLAQEAGSIITYLRRYSLSSMLGIYADDDTDGDQKQPTNKAEAKPAREQPARETPPPEKGSSKPTRPYDPETLRAGLHSKAAANKAKAQPEQCQAVAAVLNEILGNEGARHELTYWLFGKQSVSRESPDYVGDSAVMALYAWLKPLYQADGKAWSFDSIAATEAGAAHTFALQEAGQANLL